MKYNIYVFFLNFIQKIQVVLRSDTTKGHFKDPRTFMAIPRSVLLRVSEIL